MSNMTDLLRSVTNDDFVAVLNRAFADMEIAEAVISEGKEENPDLADSIDKLFLYCRRCPELMPHTVHDTLYQEHLRGLVTMLLQGAPIDLPTQVEMACGLSQVSLEVPLADEYQRWLLYHSPLATEETRECVVKLPLIELFEVERKLVEHFEEFTAWRHAYYQTEEA
jgi:hypothetical protein